MHDLGDVRAVDGVLGDEGGDPLHDGAGVVVDAGRDLASGDAAVVAEEHDIGEGAADIDPDAPAAHAPLSGRAAPCVGHLPRARPQAARSTPPRGPQLGAAGLGRGSVDLPAEARSTITP